MDIELERLAPEATQSPRVRSLVRAVVQVLCGCGIVAWAVERPWIRNQDGTARRPRGCAGMADIIGIVPGTGRFVAVAVPEIDEAGKPYEGQFGFLGIVNAAGGAGFFILDSDLDCASSFGRMAYDGGKMSVEKGGMVIHEEAK